ncbi:MAG: hypothetical protein ACXAC7_07650 [Candidatus Hodarchaeales archaeon]|jgi:hypothetical protein
MVNKLLNRLKFYNGRVHSIEKERFVEFEIASILDRYYSGLNIDSVILLEDLGPFALDFTNVYQWSKEIQDIDKKSARLFTIWAEDKETREIVVLVKGYFVLVPFKLTKLSLKEYHMVDDQYPFYPLALFTSFRTTIKEEVSFDDLIDLILHEVDNFWGNLRNELINSLDKKSDLWKRFVLSFENIIHHSFLCPSIDRELIEALKRKNCRITGVMQILASSTPSYDEVTVKSHIKEAQHLLKQYK